MRKSKLEGQLETMYRISQRETNEEVQTKISYQIKKLQRRYFSQHNHFYNPTFRKREDYSPQTKSDQRRLTHMRTNTSSRYERNKTAGVYSVWDVSIRKDESKFSV